MNVGVQGFLFRPKMPELQFVKNPIFIVSSLSVGMGNGKKVFFRESFRKKFVSEISPNSISISIRFFDSAIFKKTQSESKIFFN